MIIGVKAEFAASKEPTDNKIKLYCWRLATNKTFDFFIIACIVLNIVTMGMVYEGSSNLYNFVLEKINLFFTSVFIFECALKLYGYGVKGFMSSGSN